MSIEARDLQTWIGTEVLDSSGEKLGKLEDITSATANRWR